MVASTSRTSDIQNAGRGSVSSTGKAEQRQERPPTWEVWVTATRPHTLTASICPCIVSFAYCYSTYRARTESLGLLYVLFGFWILFCITVQIGTNLHNDYSDFVQGADNKETRVGHVRATAQGWLTPYETCLAATLTLCVTFISGVVLIAISNQWSNLLLWFLILSSVFNAFAYTGGPYPLGYIGLSRCSIAYGGLGDVFVFLYFGLVATYMVPYLLYLVQFGEEFQREQSRNIICLAMYGVQVGLLATNIIVVNNLRDSFTDALVGKRTTSVRFGKTFSLIQYCLCDIITYALVIVVYTLSGYETIRLFPLLSIFVAYKETHSVLRKSGKFLNEHVGGTAKVQFVFCILLTLSLLTS
jgi:1,4-dihydroxy-2-naphthoate polyprenyltransferase